MPRKIRFDYPGAWHHVIHRGARRAPIFKQPEDCYGFLEHVAEAIERFGIELHAYSLMPNHYHLLIRSLHASLSKAMQYLNGAYTRWLNKKHSWDGPVFRGRYKSQLVEDEEYLRMLLAYIHLNPLRANLVHRLSDEAWTSHRVYIGKDKETDWLTTKTFLRLFSDRRELHQFILSVRRGAVHYPEDFNQETGLFRNSAINRVIGHRSKNNQISQHQYGRLQDVDDVLGKIYRMCDTDLAELKRSSRGPGSNPKRRFAIWALNRSADISQREISALLSVSFHQVTRLLSRMRAKRPPTPVGDWIEQWLTMEG